MLWWERVAPFGFPVVPWNRENKQRDSIWIIVRSTTISHNDKELTGEVKKTLIISLQCWETLCHVLPQSSVQPWIGPASDMSVETGPLVVSEKVLRTDHEDRRTPSEVPCLCHDGSALKSSPRLGHHGLDGHSRLGLCQRQPEHFVKSFCADPNPVEYPWSPLGGGQGRTVLDKTCSGTFCRWTIKERDLGTLIVLQAAIWKWLGWVWSAPVPVQVTSA